MGLGYFPVFFLLLSEDFVPEGFGVLVFRNFVKLMKNNIDFGVVINYF
jgi:hypothetical protein